MSKTVPSFSFENYFEYLPGLQESLVICLDELIAQRVPQRIWEKDFTLWSEKPDEITNRLGWLTLPVSMPDSIGSINNFATEILNQGFKDVLLIGMGGSSLAPEFFEKTFEGKINLQIIDTTDPEYIVKIKSSLDPLTTLVTVSTKSGTTVETISLMNYFYNEFLNVIGIDAVGDHFIAVTDPGSMLEKTAESLKFRKTFLNDPDVGGRFSALSYYGLVPAALLGVDLQKILGSAEGITKLSAFDDPDGNIPLRFGAVMGLFARKGVDKLTIITSEKLRYFAYWAEQLIAESTGKNGKGVLPVIESEFVDKKSYSSDRLFVFINYGDDKEVREQLNSAVKNGLPAVCIEINDLTDLGGQFFNWEFATSVCGSLIGINPFDQPDVESAKVYTRGFVEEYKKSGSLKELQRTFEFEGVGFICDPSIDNIQAFKDWIGESIVEKGYLSVQAFIEPDRENEQLLNNIINELSLKFGVPATYGFGPRFLHSTGQLHKGDGGNGLFLQLVYDFNSDIDIPDDPSESFSSMSFGILNKAQSLGDYMALRDRGRKIARIELGKEVSGNLRKFSEIF